MAQFVTTIRTDLDSPLGQYTIGGKMFTQDNKANRINVELYKNKLKVNAEGEITGIVKRNDGKAVAFSGGIENGNAYVVLPETAYAIEGPIDILVRETAGDVKTVIAVCKAYVTKSADADYVTAGSTVVSIEELAEVLDQLDPLIERMQAVDVDTLSDITGKLEDVDDALAIANSIADNSFVASIDGDTLCFDPAEPGSTVWGKPEDEQVTSAVESWLEDNVNGGEIVVDSTLSISGAAADAKVTGDKFTDLKSALDEQVRDTIEEISGFTISGGKWSSNVNYILFAYPIKPTDTIIVVPFSSSVESYYFMLDSKPNPINGETPNYATGFTGYKTIYSSTELTIPEDAQYIVFMKKGGSTTYTPNVVQVNGINIYKSLQEINEENAPITEWANEIKPFITKNANLFDKTDSDITDGAYIQGSTINVDSNFNVSGYIPVSELKTYCHKVYSYFGNTANRVSCFDKNKTYINYASGTVTDGINTFTPLTGTAYVRVNVSASEMDSYMFVEGNSYPQTYIPFGLSISGHDSPLWGKKLCCDGDSIMHGAAQGGVSNGGFATPIAQRFNMTLQNIAVPGATIRSGTTWPGGDDRHWICESLEELDSDGDYYIFEGGVNDVESTAVMGTISWGYTATLDTTTFCGAFEQCCKTIVETFAGKKCGFVFVHRIWQPTDSLANSFFDNQKEILKKWGIPYIDLMELAPPLNLIDSLKSVYTNDSDGWHPNTLGYATYYIPKIIAWMESL